MSEPLISVITLIYNTGPYVIKALETVKTQSYSQIQHIIIDDCSSDNSVELVTNWIQENNYSCEFFIHKKNLGISKSLNEGLRLSRGKYVTIIGDDLFLPGKFHRQVDILENLPDEYGVVYSDAYRMNDDGKYLDNLLKQARNFTIGPEGNVFEELFFGHFIHGSAALIKKSCFDTVGTFNESLKVE